MAEEPLIWCSSDLDHNSGLWSRSLTYSTPKAIKVDVSSKNNGNNYKLFELPLSSIKQQCSINIHFDITGKVFYSRELLFQVSYQS